MKSLREAIEEATAALLAAVSFDSQAKLDAEALLLVALGREGDRAYLLAHLRDPVDDEVEHRFRELVTQRATGKPMQYILGHQEFWSLDFRVTPDVLIPRPETEHSVERVLEIVRELAVEQRRHALRIVDVGTGSGCIAVAVAYSLKRENIDVEVTGVDISSAALAVARENAARHGVGIRFLQSDLLCALLEADEQFDIIVSNPPYVGSDHPETVQRQVREFEPSIAVFGGPTGLEQYARLIPQAEQVLAPQGHLVLEIGYCIEESVRALLPAANWSELITIGDLQGIPRVVSARRR